MDRFKSSEDCVMVATDVAARGLDVEGIRTVIHYQLPHSAEVYSISPETVPWLQYVV
jgi:ATP-dependent RNA helicase DDX24/MAK5